MFAKRTVPELPEVEIIVRELNRKISGKKISRFFVFDKKIKQARISFPTRVLGVSRRGKYIVFELDCARNCIIHLRMTGQLFYEKFAYGRGLNSPTLLKASRADAEKIQRKSAFGLRKLAVRHERARFCFSDGSVLYFLDKRRFGTVSWPKRGNLPNLGIEPLSGNFNSQNFARIVRGSLPLSPNRRAGRRAIKLLLLDQRFVAGIGNIYADEALWLAKIHPRRKVKDLNVREVGKLVSAVRKVLREAIKKGGFTLRDYRRTGGESGYYQRSRKVYDREGLSCKRCRAKIKRIKVGGRSSYFCPRCQK